jgi:hypothetical protein
MRQGNMRLFDFHWPVPEDGFQWIKASGAGRDQLILVQAGANDHYYTPLRVHSALFRELADTEPTPEGIKAFADRFGCLGLPAFADPNTPPSRSKGSPFTSRLECIEGERYEDWQKEIQALRHAVELWDMARAGDEAGLSRHVRWSLDRQSVCITFLSDEKGVDTDLMEELPESEWFRPGDVIRPALFYVQGQVNRVLGHLQRVSPQLVYEPQAGQLTLHFIPENLLGAIWLQLAQAISGNKQYRQCQGCKKWFELSPEVARTNRLFCSDKCRTRAYRGRKEQAQTMAKEGKSIKEIAKELESDVNIVKSWIEHTNKGGSK